MVILIAHRGNTDGPNTLRENTPEYIQEALDKGFDVEIDVWVIDNKIFLGHDSPDYEININFLKNSRFWCHAKNFEALHLMVDNKDTIHYFSHDNDPYVLTSRGLVWTFPNNKLSYNSICVMPEYYKEIPDLSNVYGICTDYVLKYATL